MKMAQARENRKDNKGFSLVELIIVIAIMVAL
ncbi:MAG: prepilin-type N-terminal cleavage/methylation domain-containing protein, partial [Clostridia bacterium]|nr:prepilin-type N-terminal cleavage/methylation domain-containing protein [Clostridia bacterium]